MLESRFGRCARFVVARTGSTEVQTVDNDTNRNAPQGAGIQAATKVAALGVDAVVTGHTGPKAWKVLQAAGIKVYHADPAPLKDLLSRLEAGTLDAASGADTEGHW